MGGSLVAVALAVPVEAAAGAKFVLRSGEHVSGDLVDFGASGFTVRVGGQSRTWTIGQVAVIDFTGGTSFPSNEVDQAGGEHLLVLTNGQFIKGRLVDVGGTAPLRITFAQGGTNREFRSNEVARIYFAKPGASSGSTSTGTSTSGLAAASGRVRVAGTAGWVNTGLMVSQGQTLLFNSTGEVRLSTATDDVAGPAGSKKGRYAGGAPVPSVLAGALIGKIGTGAPFAIGNQTSIPSPGAGMLWLAVNDDGLSDNAGEFGVDITAQAKLRR
ncbi:MAG: hypothetical protein JJE40_15050 [Vicinamibacteria bacterium]|nr:hypothetical protein [Vicinamibacteria bacterium]